MQRTNTFGVRPLSEQDRELLLELLDASAACYNEVNNQRRQAYFEVQSDHEERLPVSELEAVVRDATTQERFRQQYIQTLGSAAPQQLVQKNWTNWKSYFALLRAFRDSEDTTVTEEPSPPGYWKDEDTRRLHTVVRNDQYTLQLGDRSRLEIPVGIQQ